jgi:hypothetical protein
MSVRLAHDLSQKEMLFHLIREEQLRRMISADREVATCTILLSLFLYAYV